MPAHISLWCYRDEVVHHHRRYAPVEVECTLTDAELSRCRDDAIAGALFPNIWLKRRLLCERSQASAQQQQAVVESDLNINSLVNWLFKLALWLDTVFIERRLRLPLGMSLLAIAMWPTDESNP